MQQVINGISVNRTGSLKKQVIIFIHGFPFDQSMWSKQVRHLNKNYCCITFDIRGLGESYVGDGISFVDDIMMIARKMAICASVAISVAKMSEVARPNGIIDPRFQGLALLRAIIDLIGRSPS